MAKTKKQHIKACWNFNKKLWHSKNIGEIHHVFLRVGIDLCCLRWFVAGKKGHQNDYAWVKHLREQHREQYNAWRKYLYDNRLDVCDKVFAPECYLCFFTLERHNFAIVKKIYTQEDLKQFDKAIDDDMRLNLK